MRLLPLILLTLSLSAWTPAAGAQANNSSSLIGPAYLLSGFGSPGPAVVTSAASPQSAPHTGPFSSIAIGVKVGVLGVGMEVATPLNRYLNLRAGGNFFNFSDTLSDSGVNYTANLRFRSAEASIDWFPWARGFHISPGALLYNGNQITATALIPGGDSFTLNDTDYISSPSDPVHGSGSIVFAKAAPKLTVGWGNLVPRSGRHFSFPFEVGFSYAGDPKVALNFAGTVCDPNGLGCQSIASDPSAQANVAGQQQKIVNDVAPARFFPILSTGFAFRF